MRYILIISMLFFSWLANGQNLDDYFKIAAENNPGLQARYKEFESALQKIPQVKSLPDPVLSISALGQMTQTRVGQQMARFSLSQMFPWFGTLKAQGEVTALNAEAKYQEFLDARNQLYYQVASAYYPLYELNQWIEIERENIQILESYKSIASIKFQNERGTMVDVLRVDIMLKEATTNLAILIQKKKPLETQFNKLLNRDEGESVIITDSMIIPDIENGYRKDSVIVGNPLLDELELKIRSSEASEKAAVKQGMPNLGLGFEYIVVNPRTDLNVPQNGQDAYMPMLTLSLPIFRSKYKAAQREAQLMQESLTLKKQDITNRLISSYDMTWYELQKQEELLQLYDEQLLESQQALNLLFKAYSNSGADFEEVLHMQQQLLKYKKMKASATTNLYVTLAEMDYITAKTRN